MNLELSRTRHDKECISKMLWQASTIAIDSLGDATYYKAENYTAHVNSAGLMMQCVPIDSTAPYVAILHALLGDP